FLYAAEVQFCHFVQFVDGSLQMAELYRLAATVILLLRIIGYWLLFFSLSLLPSAHCPLHHKHILPLIEEFILYFGQCSHIFIVALDLKFCTYCERFFSRRGLCVSRRSTGRWGCFYYIGLSLAAK
ncbi:MAG: hypothetical protein MUF77_08990, partial [Leptospira sp.]|nr:hypothetical protein [Leptospira sp.]